MKCIKCGAEIAENSNFCPICGENNSGTPNFCANCGSKVAWNMKFCETCGRPIEKLTQEQQEKLGEKVEETAKAAAEQPPVQPQPAVQPPVQPQPVVNPAPQVASAGAQLGAAAVHTAGAVAVEGVKKTVSVGKTIAIIAAIVVFLTGALAACLHFFVGAPEDTVEDFFISMEELDYEKMLGCMDKKTESTIRATLGITGDLLGSFTGISLDLEDVLALGPSMAPMLDTPDFGIAEVETVFYSDCSQKQMIEYCIQANEGETIPQGYDADNEIMNFLSEYNLTLPGLENLVAKTALVKLTTDAGEVVYLPLINEGWGDWRIPLMDLSYALEGVG